jgi:hypothetical protein
MYGDLKKLGKFLEATINNNIPSPTPEVLECRFITGEAFYTPAPTLVKMPEVLERGFIVGEVRDFAPGATLEKK